MGITRNRSFPIKYLSTLTIAAAAIVALATGCGSSDSDGTVRLRLVYPPSEDATPQVVRNFEKANPDIKVDIETVPPRSIAQQVLTQLRAGNAPDVFYLQPGTYNAAAVRPLAESGRLADLSETSVAKAVPDAVKSGLSVDGKVYALPLGVSVITAYYDADQFQKLGLKVPETFDEMISLCQQVRKQGKSLFLLAGGVPTVNAQMILNLAVNAVYPQDPTWNEQRSDKKTTFASSEGWRTALSQFKEMNAAGCFQDRAIGSTIANSPSLWAKGSSLAAYGNSGFMTVFKAAKPRVRFSTFAVPAAESDDTRITVSNNSNLAVNADSVHKDAAIKLVDWFARPDQQRLWNKSAETIPPTDYAAGDYKDFPERYQSLVPFFKSNRTVVEPAYTMPAGVYDLLGSDGTGLLTGQKDTDEVISDLDRTWDQK